MEEKVELEIVGLSHTVSKNQSYAVVLGEVGGTKKLPIIIGGFEAQAIAVAMENMAPARPLTHDLAKNICFAFQIKLTEVIICDIVDDIFYAQLVCKQNDKEITIDSRTSDALALAVRFECPIYTYKNILENSGIILEESESSKKLIKKKPIASSDTIKSKKGDLTTYNLKELNVMLDKALENEDYEKAASIRDEINNRQ